MEQIKVILKGYLIKMLNNEIKRQLRYMESKTDIYPTMMKEVLNMEELFKIKKMMLNVYDVKVSDMELLQWELLGINKMDVMFDDWIKVESKKGTIVKDLNQDNYNTLRFKMNEGILK